MPPHISLRAAFVQVGDAVTCSAIPNTDGGKWVQHSVVMLTAKAIGFAG